MQLGTAYYLECERPQARSQVFTFSAESREQWIEMACDEREPQVTVLVTDEHRKPWEGVSVRIHKRLPEEQMDRPPGFIKTNAGSRVTDEEGRAEFPLKMSGPMRLTLVRGGGTTVQREFNIEPGEDRSFELTFPRGDSLFGRFTDEFGQPLSRHSVSYQGLSTSTNEQGLFELHGLTRGRWGLTIQRRDRNRRELPTLLTWMHFPGVFPSDDRVEFRRSAPVAFHGTYDSESEIVESRWAVEFPQGGRYTHNRVHVRDGIARLSVASNSRPWSIKVEQVPGNHAPRLFTDLAPQPGTVVDLGNLQLSTKRTLGGTVRWPDASPAAGVTVDLTTSVSSWSTEMTTDSQGAFLFKNVPMESGTVYCSHDDEQDVEFAAEVSYGDSALAVALDLDLVAQKKARGVVRRADGTPVPNARVWLFHVTESGKYGSGSGARSSADGTFEVDLDAGEFQVFVEPFGAGDMVACQRFEMSAAADIDLVVELP